MRSISLITFLLLSTISYCQTAVISTKSHSGDIANVVEEADNFGEMAPQPIYDTVIFVGESCIVEIGTKWGNRRFHDTICNHWAFDQKGYTLNAARSYYGMQPAFIGFKEPDDNDQDGWNRGRTNQNSLIGLFGLIMLSYLAYLITPIFRNKLN